MRLTIQVGDSSGSPLSPVHSYLTSRGYTFPSYEEWKNNPAAPRVDSPEVQRVLKLKPGDWGTEQYRQESYERARQFALENTGAKAPVPPKGTVYGPPSQESEVQRRAQVEAQKQARLSAATQAKAELVAAQERARDAAQQRYQREKDRAAAEGIRAAQVGARAAEGRTYDRYRGPSEPLVYGTEAGEKRLTPSGMDLGGSLTSESRVLTGDYQRRNIQMYGTTDLGRIRRTETTAQTATPIYKPGDQRSIPIAQQWSQEDIRQRQLKMVRAGVLSGESASRSGTWGIAETMAAEQVMGWANLNGWNFDRALDTLVMDADARQKAGLDGGSGSGAGAGPLSTTNVSYSLSSLDQARQALAAAMAVQIGRKPTDAEVRQFLGQLNAKERKAPITTVTSRNSAGSYSTTRQTDRSVDAGEEATRFTASKAPGEVQAYGEVQYYDILNSVIGG